MDINGKKLLLPTMKHNYITAITVISLTFSLFCAAVGAQATFQRHFSDFTEYQKLSKSTLDESYVIASSTRDQVGYYDFSAVKVDKNGQIIWSKTFPSTGDDYLTSLFIAPSGDILLGGYKLNGDGNFDFSLMKIDAAGKLQWRKGYGTAGMDVSVYAGVTTSGDIYMSGSIEKDSNKSLWVLKLDNSGAVLWSKMYAAPDVNAATITSDDGLVVMGSSYFMKINSGGTVAFTTKLQFEPLDIASIKQTGNGSFIYCGKISYCTTVACSHSFAFMNIDQNGKVLWSKNYKGFGQGKDAVETTDGGFAFAGQLIDAPGTTGTKLAVVKTDNKGTHLWTKVYGNADSNGEYACVENTADGGCLILGVEDSKALLIKTDVSGSTSCNDKTVIPVYENTGLVSATTTLVEKSEVNTQVTPVCTEAIITLTDSTLCNATSIKEFARAGECKIFPNPFRESAVLEILDYIPSGSLEFNMYDVFGRKVMQSPFSNQRLLIARGSLPNGMYFYEVRDRQKIIGSGKIIAE